MRESYLRTAGYLTALGGTALVGLGGGFGNPYLASVGFPLVAVAGELLDQADNQKAMHGYGFKRQ